jgi:hypothetical protein
MAIWLPGWDSMEAAAKWHKGFEIAGFVALGLLLLFEILTYLYSNRWDALNVQFQLAAAQTRLQQEQIADQRRDAEIAEARRQANEARDAQQVAQQKIDALTATRTLTDQQEQVLIKALSPYKGAEIIIRNAQGNKECQDYADQFRHVFQQSGWTLARAPFRIVIHEGENVQMMVGNIMNPPQRAIAIQAALKEIGIEAPGNLDESVGPDVVQLYIGFKVDKPPSK